MLRLIGREESLEHCGELERDIFAIRIAATLKAYGADADFARFYCDKERNTLISVLDSAMTISVNEKSDLEELAEFIKIIGCRSLLCDAELARRLQLKVSSEGLVMKLSEQISTDLSPPCRVDAERLSGLFPCIFPNGTNEEFSAWYCDASHRLRHSKIRAVAFYSEGRAVCTAMTTAELSGCAIVGGVATAEAYRRQGLASRAVSALCADLLSEGRAVYLCSKNSHSDKLYKKLGFKELSRWAYCEFK